MEASGAEVLGTRSDVSVVVAVSASAAAARDEGTFHFADFTHVARIPRLMPRVPGGFVCCPAGGSGDVLGGRCVSDSGVEGLLASSLAPVEEWKVVRKSSGDSAGS